MTEATDLTITRLDPFDDATFAAWHRVYVEALEGEVGDAAQCWTLPELLVELRRPASNLEPRGYVGRVAGRVVVSGYLGLPQLDNLSTAHLDVNVAPSDTGRGLGRAMADHLEAEAAAAGRTVLNAEVRWPHELGALGTGSRSVAFAEARGYALGLSDVQRRLERPVPLDVLDALAAEAATRHEGYTLHAFTGPVPDAWAEEWVALDATLMVEAPSGDLEIEAMNADVSVLRERDANLEAQGRTPFHTIALDPDGHVVGYTTIVHGIHDQSGAHQWGTLVHRDHRGHRLGVALKAANHRQFQEQRPDVDRVTTWNAEVNAHMIGVNERLGFVPSSRMGEFQKRA